MHGRESKCKEGGADARNSDLSQFGRVAFHIPRDGGVHVHTNIQPLATLRRQKKREGGVHSIMSIRLRAHWNLRQFVIVMLQDANIFIQRHSWRLQYSHGCRT
jgi:hypothetical protein